MGWPSYQIEGRTSARERSIHRFTAGAGTVTLPLQIYSMIKIAVTPEVNAASTILIVLTLTLMVGAMAIQSRWGSAAKVA